MQTVRLESWQEFRGVIDTYQVVRPTYWRGQAHPGWPLASSFERRILALNGGATEGPSAIHPYDERLANILRLGNDIVATRQQLQQSFERSALGLRGASPQELDWDAWWALGRHFGLITPFLDWTEKPYIAAFFAFTDYLEQLSRDGRRFRERTGRRVAIYRLIQEANLTGVRSEGTFHILRPSVNELIRMHRQRSVFTFLESYTFFELQGYFDTIGMGDVLTQFVMPDSVIYPALRDLELHGIDYLSLFPDLEGAARQANAEWRNSPLGKIES